MQYAFADLPYYAVVIVFSQEFINVFFKNYILTFPRNISDCSIREY